MNICVPDSWLREFLTTKASVRQIAEYLSLCGQSVEKITRDDNDFIYEIEITTNRPDCLSVYGIARELKAILPRFGIKVTLKPAIDERKNINKIKNPLPFNVEIKNKSLCPRFTAIIFDNIKIKPSPAIIQQRLVKSGIRSLNNVVDISNYLMLELGQPMHTFDYDKIGKAKMILRESIKGEKIVTLDGQNRLLPPGTIIIEDGGGRIIDLCGIMGGDNSAVEEKTTRVLLFVQTYDPTRIRKSCQQMAFHTEAAQRFEKGIEPEGVTPAIKKAMSLFKTNCSAGVASNLIDIYPNPPKKKVIKLDFNLVDKLVGIHLTPKETIGILQSLGFIISGGNSRTINCLVPHWRHGDVSIPEDLIEEIARIYGYHSLPALLPEGQIPQKAQSQKLYWERLIKDRLKNWGFIESVSYSMISEQMLSLLGYKTTDALKISNPLTEDLVYLRPALIGSILDLIKKNQAENNDIQVFELANIYLPQAKYKLPQEVLTLTAALTGQKFVQLKGILEALFEEMGINNAKFTANGKSLSFFQEGRTAIISITNKIIGHLGEIDYLLQTKLGLKNKITLCEISFSQLVNLASKDKKFVPIPKYPPISEDLAFIVPERILIGNLIQEIRAVDRIISNVELFDSYKNTRTFRIIYQHPTKSLSDEIVIKIREKIIKTLKEKFRARIKTGYDRAIGKSEN